MVLERSCLGALGMEATSAQFDLPSKPIIARNQGANAPPGSARPPPRAGAIAMSRLEILGGCAER